MKKQDKTVLKKNIKIDSKVLREYDKLQSTKGITLHRRGDYRAGKSVKDSGIHHYGVSLFKRSIEF